MDDLPQPGSLEAEAGVFCSTFDMTGTRLITGGADKTIKVRALFVCGAGTDGSPRVGVCGTIAVRCDPRLRGSYVSTASRDASRLVSGPEL